MRPVRNVLTAGSSLRVVQRDRRERDRYYLHGDLYKALARIRARSVLAVYGERARVAWGGAMLEAPAALTDAANPQLPPPLSAFAANAESLLAQSDDDLRAAFLQSLMRALGLTMNSYLRISEPEIAAEALAAANALRRQARMHLDLNSQLRLQEADNRRVLEQVQQTLAESSQHDPHALDILGEVAREIAQRLPIMMLLPEGGLMERLILALEESNADNGLSEAEHYLLAKLRTLKREVELMDLSDASAWRRFARHVEHLNTPGPLSPLQVDTPTPTKH